MKEYLYLGILQKLVVEGKLHIAFFYIGIVLCAALAYVLGSLNTAVIISKLKYKEDIREYGSKNAGATNMLRVYGKIPALITLLLDFFKCVIAVLIGRFLCGYDWGALCGMCCAFGHAFPCFYGFKGGKCVAVTAAFLLCIEPMCFLVALGAFLLFALTTRYVSLGSIFAAMISPVVYYNYYLTKYNVGHGTVAVVFVFITCMLVVFLHKDNIKRLREGKEHKIGDKNNK